MSELTILYSFRRCPYAMRARLALFDCNLRFEWREILLRDKPADFLAISKDKTVPVLRLGDDVIQESIEIMRFAYLSAHDQDFTPQEMDLIARFEVEFKAKLDLYKYSQDQDLANAARDDAVRALASFMPALNPSGAFSPFDYAILPFIRQFAHVDREWFDQNNGFGMRKRLDEFTESTLFKRIMEKLPPWQIGAKPVIIGDKEVHCLPKTIDTYPLTQ